MRLTTPAAAVVGLVAVALVLGLTSTTYAATITYQTGGGQPDNWTDGSNWVGGVAPGAADDAQFDNDANFTQNVPASLLAIIVNNGSTVTISRNGNLALTGNAYFVPISIGLSGGSTLNITTATTVQMSARVDVNDSTLNISGTLEAAQDIAVLQNDSGHTICGGLLLTNELKLTNTGAADTIAPMTVNGDIRFGADDTGHLEAFDTYANAGNYWQINLNGNITANGFTGVGIDADGVLLHITGANSQLIGNLDDFDGGYDSDVWIGSIVVEAGASFSVQAGIFDEVGSFSSLVLYLLENNGTFRLNGNSIQFGGSLDGSPAVMIDNANGTLLDLSSNRIYATWWGAADSTNYLRGTIVFDGPTVFDDNSVYLVELGSTVTFNSTLQLDQDFTEVIFGADDDGGTTTNQATINYMGTVNVASTAFLRLGEGVHNFHGNLDASGASSSIELPVTTPNTPPQMHFLGAAQTVALDTVSGLPFTITSVGTNTAITLTGQALAYGNFNLGNSTAATVLSAPTATVQFVNAGAAGSMTLTMGDGNATIGTALLPQIIGGSLTDQLALTITRSTGKNGVLTINSFTVEGDTNDDGAGDDMNAASLAVDNAALAVGDGAAAGGLFLLDGSQAAGNTFAGSTLAVSNSASITVRAGGTLRIGDAGFFQGETAAGAKATISASAVTLQTGASLALNPSAALTISTGSTITGPDTWMFSCDSNAEVLSITNSTISSQTSGSVTLDIGAKQTTIAGNTFANYDAAGLNLLDNTNLLVLQGNTFSGGLTGAGNAHITIAGDLALNGGLNADANTFASIGIAAGGSGGLFVNNAGAPDANLTFRVAGGQDFGNGVSAATAEADADNDGTGAIDVLWSDTAEQLDVQLNGAQPSAFQSDANSHAILRFTMQAVNGSLTVTALTYTLTPGGGLAISDFAETGIFADLDSDGEFDTGEEITNGSVASPGSNTIALTGLSVVPGAVATEYGIYVIFNGGGQGKGGTIGVQIGAGQVTEAGGSIVTGLPVQNATVSVSGPPAALAVTAMPTSVNATSVFGTSPKVELRDAFNNLVSTDNTTQVTVTIKSGTGATGATLTGTATVTVVNGVATFSDLSIDLIGTAYQLTFTIAGPITVDSATFNVVLGGGGGGIGGGGGSCGSLPADPHGSGSPLALLWLLALLVGLCRIRRNV